MKLGAEPKRLALLGALVLFGGYEFYSNVLSNPASEPAAPRASVSRVDREVAAAAAVQPMKQTAIAGPVRRAARVRTGEDFRPSLKPPARPEDRPDPMSIDPTLRLDLLGKVQAVPMQGGERNLFQFSTPPPPPLKGPEPKVVPKTPAQIQAEAKLAQAKAGPPPPPAINLKYYGFSSARLDGRKKAFFLDGEDILVATEGDVVKKRYKVVRIGINSVVMEDMDSKHEQTLPLVEENVG